MSSAAQYVANASFSGVGFLQPHALVYTRQSRLNAVFKATEDAVGKAVFCSPRAQSFKAWPAELVRYKPRHLSK